MNKTWIIFSAIVVFISTTVSAQQQNPFDLRWKKSGTSKAQLDSSALPKEEIAPATLVVPVQPEVMDTPIVETSISESAVQLNEGVSDSSNDNLITEVATNSEDSVAVEHVEEEISPAKTIRSANTADQPNTLALLLLFGLALLLVTWVTTSNRGFVRKIYRAALNENFSGLLMREHKFNATQYLYYIIYGAFFVNISIFVYLLMFRTDWFDAPAKWSLLLIMGTTLLIYLGRHGTLKVIASIFPISQEINHFNFNLILYNILAGLILMPLNLLLAFGPAILFKPVIIISLVAGAILYLLRQFRGVVIGSHVISLHPFQFFIYLCAIEILPVLVIVKFFITD